MLKPGFAELDIHGEKRGFKFGTWAIAVACKEYKCSQTELFKKIGDPDNMDIMALLYLFYGAAVHYCDSKKIEIDFSPSDVSDWLDEIGLEKSMEIFKEGFKVHEPKNVLTPEALPG